MDTRGAGSSKGSRVAEGLSPPPGTPPAYVVLLNGGWYIGRDGDQWAATRDGTTAIRCTSLESLITLVGAAEVEAEFPAWHVWRGVAGLWYARRPRSPPPKVLRARSISALRMRIALSEEKKA